MLIGKNWQITSNSMNVILSHKERRKNPITKQMSDSWADEGFYATVPGALKALVNQEVRDTGLKDLETISKAINGLYDMIQACTFTNNQSTPGASKDEVNDNYRIKKKRGLEKGGLNAGNSYQ